MNFVSAFQNWKGDKPKLKKKKLIFYVNWGHERELERL